MDLSSIIQTIREEAEKRYKRRWRVLARRLSWSLSKLSRVLSGDQQMALPEFLLLCQVLGLSAAQLLTGVAA